MTGSDARPANEMRRLSGGSRTLSPCQSRGPAQFHIIYVSANAFVPHQRTRRREALQHVRHVLVDADGRADEVLKAIAFRDDICKTSPHPVGRDSGFEIDWSRENYVVVMGTRSSSG
jgi:hypothetical protein